MDNFESGSPAWTLAGEFERNTPTGLGGSDGKADPSSAYQGNYVMGTDLSGLGSNSGDYEPSLGFRQRLTIPQDCCIAQNKMPTIERTRVR